MFARSIIAALWMAAPWLPESTVRGTVRTGDTSEPIPAALVEIVGTGPRSITDSAGQYVLRGLTPGAYLVRVSRIGFESAALTLYVGTDSVVHLDVALAPRPIVLPQVDVTRPRGPGSTPSVAGVQDAGDHGPEVGMRRLAGDALHANPALPDADVLAALALTPDVTARPEAPTALHVRGGSADQNAILIDGVPVFNPYHAAGTAGTLSAVNPDVVSAIALHAGVPSARYGEAASGVITIRTVDSAAERITAYGALGLASVRQTVRGPLLGTRGSFLVAGRRSLRDVLSAGGIETSTSSHFADLFAKAVVPTPGRGSLEFFALANGDRLAFDAGVEPDRRTATGAGGDSASPTPRNAVSWSAATQALIWQTRAHGSIDSERDPRWTVRAWHTRFAATADWAAITGPLRMTSGLREIGGEAMRAWRLPSSRILAGVGAKHLDIRYEVAHVPTSDSPSPMTPATPAAFILASSTLLGWAFVEDTWQPTPAMSVTAGAREAVLGARPLGMEPRVSARFELGPAAAISVGYARLHQSVQSLRNEESALDALYGITLPVRVSGRPSVARTDQVVLNVEGTLGPRLRGEVEGYVRVLDGITLIAPSTAQPFVLDGTASGSPGTGRAVGMTLHLSHRDDRLTAEAAYALGAVERRTLNLLYQPSFAATHGFAASVGYRLWPSTTLRAATVANSARPSSILTNDFEWTSDGPVAGPIEVAGSPQERVDPLNSGRLPPYVRLDVGLRHDWRVVIGGRAGTLTALVNLTNVLDRANAFWIVRSPVAASSHTLTMLPRTLTLGVQWAY